MKLPSIRLPSLPPGTAEAFSKNLYTILAIIVIVAILIGYMFFYASIVNPAMNARNAIAAQVVSARQTASARGVLPESPDSLQARLNTVRSTITASSKFFLTEALVSDYIKRLYQYADESGVTIIDFKTTVRFGALPVVTPTAVPPPATTVTATVAPTPVPPQTGQPTVLLSPVPTRPPATQTPTRPPQPSPAPVGADLFRTTSVRLQARGTSNQLVEFVSRIKETMNKGVVVTLLTIEGGEKNALLNLELAMVSSPTAEVPTATRPPAPAQTQAPIIPTPVPVIPTPAPVIPTLIPQTPTWTPTNIVLPTLTPIPTSTLAPRAIHTVRASETVYSISRQYGITIEALMAANHLTSYTIYVGQQLIIPR
jgi:LysM repeat protein